MKSTRAGQDSRQLWTLFAVLFVLISGFAVFYAASQKRAKAEERAASQDTDKKAWLRDLRQEINLNMWKERVLREKVALCPACSGDGFTGSPKTICRSCSGDGLK